MDQANGGHFHAVRFYDDDQSLSAVVAGFIAEGLTRDEPALVVATDRHGDAIVENLTALGVDVAACKEAGDLVVLDARATLNTFMVKDQPDADFFKVTASYALESISRGRTKTIRVYGEMVDVLWQDGMSAAAIKLEILWNRLAATHDFSLLCGYATGNFSRTAMMDDVCRHHTHVVSDNGTAARVS